MSRLISYILRQSKLIHSNHFLLWELAKYVTVNIEFSSLSLSYSSTSARSSSNELDNCCNSRSKAYKRHDMFSIMCMYTIHAFDQETALQFQYDPQKKFYHLYRILLISPLPVYKLQYITDFSLYFHGNSVACRHNTWYMVIAIDLLISFTPVAKHWHIVVKIRMKPQFEVSILTTSLTTFSWSFLNDWLDIVLFLLVTTLVYWPNRRFNITSAKRKLIYDHILSKTFPHHSPHLHELYRFNVTYYTKQLQNKIKCVSWHQFKRVLNF